MMCQADRDDRVAPSREAPFLSCHDVSVSFGGVQAVDNASIQIDRGSVTGLIGPNGAGKSTLINVLSGFLEDYGGQVVFDGIDVSRSPAYKIARLGLMRTFQLPSEFAKMTVLENLMVAPSHQFGDGLWAALFRRRRWREQEYNLLAKARELLEDFGLSSLSNEYAGNLSGGQKRLLELSRALMAEPKALILDEPMAGVAPGMVDRLVEHITEINRTRGLTFLIVEHDLEVVDRLCPTVAVMVHGRVVAEGSMSELREDEQVVEAYLS